jgi:hypothetical protein
VDSLKALDPRPPIREADIAGERHHLSGRGLHQVRDAVRFALSTVAIGRQ